MVRIVDGNTFLGVANTTEETIDLTGKVRFKTGYIELNAFVPLLASETPPELIVSLGVASMKPGIKIAASPMNATTLDFTSQFTPIEGRSKAVFRFGLGFQSLLVENVGARILWRFENTSTLRARNTRVVETENTRGLFKDAQTVVAGLFVKF